MDANQKPQFDDIEECARGIAERIEALGIKGPKSQANEALAYAVGFAKALTLVYPGVTLPIVGWIQFDLAFSGMSTVKRANKASELKRDEVRQ